MTGGDTEDLALLTGLKHFSVDGSAEGEEEKDTSDFKTWSSSHVAALPCARRAMLGPLASTLVEAASYICNFSFGVAHVQRSDPIRP